LTASGVGDYYKRFVPGLFKIENLVLRSNLFMVSGVRTEKVSGVSVQVSAIMSVISEALTLKYGVSTRVLFQTL
jgi:hypothetical protein